MQGCAEDFFLFGLTVYNLMELKARGYNHSPGIYRVEVAAAARRRAMKLYDGTANGP